MVGVAGKYKGCNTCRTRRVKCDNTRPACKKCINSGRECEGYERPRVWIVGTAKERGRCSSHPHRSLQGSSSKVKQKAAAAAAAATSMSTAGTPSSSSQTPRPSSTSATTPSSAYNVDMWGENIDLYGSNPFDSVQCVALHTQFPELGLDFGNPDSDGLIPPFNHQLPHMTSFNPALDFSLKAMPLVNSGSGSLSGQETGSMATGETSKPFVNQKAAAPSGSFASSLCLFLYEQKAGMGEDLSTWNNLLGGSTMLVKQRGPAAFRAFPDHHMFVRLYRNSAIFDAMAHRKSTFLSGQDWCTVPWEDIPKTTMDYLFDILVQLPALFERTERLLRYPPSVQRNLKAQDLLQNCLYVEGQLNQWFENMQTATGTAPYWRVTKGPEIDAANMIDYDPEIREVYEFSCTNVALMHMYYWSSLILFYRVIQEIQVALATTPSAGPSSVSAPAVTNSMYFDAQMGYANMSLNVPTYPSTDPATQYAASTPQSSPFSSPGSQRSYVSQQSPFTSPAAAFTQSSTFDAPSIYASHMTPLFPPPSLSSYAAVQPPSYSHSALFSSQPSFAVAPVQPVERSLDPRFQDSSIAMFAHNICRSMDYILRETSTSIGPDCCAFPLWTALQFYRRNYYSSADLQWCEKLLDKLRRAGSTFAQEMAKMQWQRFE